MRDFDFMEESEILKSDRNRFQNKWKILQHFVHNKKLNVQDKRVHAFQLFTSRILQHMNVIHNDISADSDDPESDYDWFEYDSNLFPECRLHVRYG